MRTHSVEVDDEVFSLVKAHAEPLVDTFNTALRRLLPVGSPVQATPNLAGETESRTRSVPLAPIPDHAPQALRQILEVAQLARTGGCSRIRATEMVADKHGVFTQTVLDKYCRQLGLTASRFDQLLGQEDLADLRGILKSKFRTYAETIDAALGSAPGA